MTVTDLSEYRPGGDLYPTRGLAARGRIERTHPTVWPGEQHSSLLPEHVDLHARSGFTVVDQMLYTDEVKRYWDELGRLSADPDVRADERTIVEKSSQEVRSIFEVHQISECFAELIRDPRLVGRARRLLGSDVYVHQSRINYMPGFKGKGFYWHSDFETWHAEDGMPLPRAVSISIALADNYPYNGGLMVMPGSQNTFVSCAGETPEDNYKYSLKEQDLGIPDEETLRSMAYEYGIEQFTGRAGSALIFDCNMMHGSGNNITPFPRSNIFVVYNSVENTLVEPYAAAKPRPTFLASRDFTPVGAS